MIGTIRKHSKWLWWFIIAATVVGFVYWGVGPNARNGGLMSAGNYGVIYGHKITQEEYANALHDVDIMYWFRNREWPDRSADVKDKDLQEQAYLRLMLMQKASDLGISVSDDQAAVAADDLLRSLDRQGRPVPIQQFVTRFLSQEGLTEDDFKRFARDDMTIRQLIQTLGMAGALITPQEAAASYLREHQEMSSEIVFFQATNYLARVAVTPAAVAQFYTNYLAEYRQPERVQVNYLEFNLSNYLPQAVAELSTSNFDTVVDENYHELGPDYFPDAKTPAAAKARIREMLFRQKAMADAKAQANDFATELFNMSPVKADNLAALAKQKGLTMHTTPPFSNAYGPDNSPEQAAFTKTAFGLTPDDPLAGPIQGNTAYFVIALDKRLPEEIPPLDQIREQVTQDYRMVSATLMAQRAGTNFAATLAPELAAGHSFAAACIAAGLQPESLPPFSISTQDLPALADRASINQLKQAAFSLPNGRASGFEETQDGGFIVYVQSRLPVDQTAMNADLPQFTAELRRERESEIFNEWVGTEGSRELRNTPAFLDQSAPGVK